MGLDQKGLGNSLSDHNLNSCGCSHCGLYDFGTAQLANYRKGENESNKGDKWE